jgi:hypothetical protein
MLPIVKLVVSAALPAAFLLGTSSPCHAQATPIANGHLEGGPTPSAPAPSILDLTFSLVQLPDGSLIGGGKLTNKAAGGWILFDLTSYMFVGDTLFAAGPVTQTYNTAGIFEVGDLFVLAINDNGNGSGSSAPDEFIEGAAPAALGLTTIQEVFALIGPPPPEFFRQGLSGDLTIH